MRNKGILLAMVVVLVATSGCTRCRNFFRRGAPCGTASIAPPMMGMPRPLGNAYVAAPQPTQAVMPQMLMPQAGCCEQMMPQCCEPCCPNDCMPCESGFGGGDCCPGEMVGQGQWFGGYVGDDAPQGNFVPQGSSNRGNDPGPVGK